jgi:hypothetical protein
MTVTIGSFSTNRLNAQPFGYEGEARTGLTARTFRISGLLTPAEWQTLVSEYNAWRSTRIQNEDTLLSKTVGTTIALTVTSANNLFVTNLACWFTEAPSGDQTGKYVSATVTLVDAAQALAVILRKQELDNERRIAEAQNVDCAVIAAELQRQKDDADCEIAALQTGLADDFAQQALTKQDIEATAKATAYAGGTATLESIKAAEANVELLERQAEVAARSAYASDIAAAELQLEALSADGKATAYAANTGSLEQIKGSEIDIELLQSAAQVVAWSSGTRLDDLKAARALQSVYDRYIGEDLPDLGTVSLGGVTITLTKPADTRSDGPQVALTATGASYITGPLTAHESRQIEGIITNGSFATLLSWYDSTVSSVPSPGTWFPTSAPTASAEPFLISGAKGTRWSVSLEVKKIR